MRYPNSLQIIILFLIYMGIPLASAGECIIEILALNEHEVKILAYGEKATKNCTKLCTGLQLGRSDEEFPEEQVMEKRKTYGINVFQVKTLDGFYLIHLRRNESLQNENNGLSYEEKLNKLKEKLNENLKEPNSLVFRIKIYKINNTEFISKGNLIFKIQVASSKEQLSNKEVLELKDKSGFEIEHKVENKDLFKNKYYIKRTYKSFEEANRIVEKLKKQKGLKTFIKYFPNVR